jgi:hypothetical protein
MSLYFCKPPNVVMSVHSDDQIWIDPVVRYGSLSYVLVDFNGPAPTHTMIDNPASAFDPSAPDKIMSADFNYPTITPQMLSDSVKLECRRRIAQKVSDQAQRNITTHINDIQMARMTQAPARPPTTQEQSDMDITNAIWAWIGAATRAPTSMLGTCDALIAASDVEFYQDVKWPPWDTAWDPYVAKF